MSWAGGGATHEQQAEGLSATARRAVDEPPVWGRACKKMRSSFRSRPQAGIRNPDLTLSQQGLDSGFAAARRPGMTERAGEGWRNVDLDDMFPAAGIVAGRARVRHALVAQLDRASDFESEGREFESLRARQRLAHFRTVCSSAVSPQCPQRSLFNTAPPHHHDPHVDEGRRFGLAMRAPHNCALSFFFSLRLRRKNVVIAVIAVIPTRSQRRAANGASYKRRHTPSLRRSEKNTQLADTGLGRDLNRSRAAGARRPCSGAHSVRSRRPFGGARRRPRWRVRRAL